MLAKRKNGTPETKEKEGSWGPSVFTIGDKIRLVAIAVTLFLAVIGWGISLTCVMLAFWNDTSVRLSVLEQRVDSLEHPQVVQVKPDAVAKKE